MSTVGLPCAGAPGGGAAAPDLAHRGRAAVWGTVAAAAAAAAAAGAALRAGWLGQARGARVYSQGKLEELQEGLLGPQTPANPHAAAEAEREARRIAYGRSLSAGSNRALRVADDARAREALLQDVLAASALQCGLVSACLPACQHIPSFSEPPNSAKKQHHHDL